MQAAPSESPLPRVTTQQREFVVGIVVALLALVAFLIWRATDTPTAEPLAPTTVRSLVVLPLHSEEKFLSYGVANELAAALASVPGLRIAPTPPGFAFDRRSPDDLGELATLLNVGGVLHGTLRRSGAKIELTMQLRFPADDSTLWSAAVTGDTAKLAVLENTVAESVARVLRAQLGLPRTAVVAVTTADPTAHALVLRAAYLRGLATTTALDSAVILLEEAVRHDSTYARAWSALAAITPQRARAMHAARRAIALDSTLAEPHVAMGRLHAAAGDTASAQRAYLTAIRRDPRLPSARYEYSRLLAARGSLDEALREARRAHELDPLAQAVHRNYVEILDRAGHDMEAKHELAELRRMAKYLGSQQ
jgi:TolB-like protein/Tfp pilus assembly protein PilF